MRTECNTPVRETQEAERAPSTRGAHVEQLRQASHSPHPATTTDLRSAWITLLARYHWDLFGSLTFRDDTHPESAMKRFRLFVSIINRKLYGPRWAKHNKGISWCVAMERQARGVLHFHCLLADPELTNLLKGSWFKLNGRWANELNETWNELAGFARIEPIKVAELVQRYVSKYVIKGGQIDLGGPMMQRRLEQAPIEAKATTSQRGGRGLVNHSVSVPEPPSPAEGQGVRHGVQGTPSLAPCSFLTGCSAVRSDLDGAACSTPGAQGTSAHEGRAVSLELFQSTA